MIETFTTLIFPVAAYLLCLASLTYAAWLATCFAVPGHCRGGLRLTLVLIGQIAFTAIVIQALGLLGKLRFDVYLVICVLIGGLSFVGLRRWFPDRSLLRLIRQHVQLWLWATPSGLGWLGFALIGFLALRASFVEGIDSMSIHGPMVVEWLQAQKVTLLWHYNYPICWEYQFAANMLMMGSDLLVVIPRVWITLTLLLLAKEVGRQFGLNGGLSQLAAWLGVLTPLVLGVQGEWSLKNDAALGVGLLACLVGIDRQWRGRSGGFWSLLLGAFLAIGVKSTGVILGLGFLVLGLCLGFWRNRQALGPKNVIWVLVAVTLLQATPMALPTLNYLENGSPFYPIVLKIGDWIELPGVARIEGTSIWDHRNDPGIWKKVWLGAAFRISFETLIVFPLFVLGLFWWVSKWVRLAIRRGPLVALFDRRGFPRVFYSTAGAVLFLIFLATPWSAGVGPVSIHFAQTGGSLRYTLASVVLIYLSSAIFWSDVVGPKSARRLLIVLLPAVFYQRWSPTFFHLTRKGFENSNLLMVGFLAGLALFWGLGRLAPKLDRALRGSRLRKAGWPIVLSMAFLSILPWYSELRDKLRWDLWGMGPTSMAYRELWTYVWEEMPEGSVIACNMKQPSFNYSYFLFGPKLKNRLIKGEFLTAPPEAQYFYVTFKPPRPQLLEESIETLKSRGWAMAARVDGDRGALMKRLSEFESQPGTRDQLPVAPEPVAPEPAASKPQT